MIRRRKRVTPEDVFKPEEVAEGEIFRPRPSLASPLDDALRSSSQQVALLGEPGVGKSSLLAHAAIQRRITVVFIRCYASMTKDDLIGKFVGNRTIQTTESASAEVGYGSAKAGIARSTTRAPLSHTLSDSLREIMERHQIHLVALENFHRVESSELHGEVIHAMEEYYDTKGPKLLVLGKVEVVAPILDLADDDRRIKQIVVPRMEDEEIQGIYNFGFDRLAIAPAPNLLRNMVAIADGIPHFAHLHGLKTARRCISRSDSAILEEDVQGSLHEISRESRATEFHRFLTAAEPTGAVRPRKMILLMLAQDSRREWTAQDVAELWMDTFSRNRDVSQIREDLRKLTDRRFGGLLRKRRVRSGNVFSFTGPVTRVCLRIIAQRDDPDGWYLLNPDQM